MQTLHQELELSPFGDRVESHPGLRGLMADQAIAYAEEVRILRQRVATLESALAAAKVAPTASDGSPCEASPFTSIDVAYRTDRDRVLPSEFVEETTPAVMAVARAAHRQPHPPAPTEAEFPDNAETEPAAQIAADTTIATAVADAEPVPNPGFAQAWSAVEPTASFEERVAERAFFQASTVDQESRTWLLDN